MATRGAAEVGGQPVDEIELKARIDGILNRRPTVGLAVGVVRDGRLECFHGHGLADIASRKPITEDTVFRVGSVTKTFTAIAVMQLWEQGLVDLDAPANDYLRAYKLFPAKAGFRPATVRHLLTHTAGIREVLHPSGLLRMRDLGETVKPGRPVPSLAEYYRGGLRIDAQPGTRFMYTNHGFATLGQLVEDVSGKPLDRYLRQRIFDPLGMADTDLVRPERVRSRLATGYELRSHGAKPVTDYAVITAGGGAVSSTPRDMARYLAALLGGGANEHGNVLEPATMAAMFEPHYRPDPRIPGFGLAFFRANLHGHLAVEHDGILPGFDAQISLAPDDGVGVMAFANGARRGMHWLAPEVGGLLRRLLGVPDEVIRTDVPHHPEIWGDLCGWYRFSAHPSDPARFAIGAGAEVLVRRGQLVIRALSPIPALYGGFLLHPDDEQDPYVFRIELPWFGIGTGRVVFSQEPGVGTTAAHLDFAPLSFQKQPPRRIHDCGPPARLARSRWPPLRRQPDGAGGPGRIITPIDPRVTVRTMSISIDRLTALDQLMLRASEIWPQHIGALALLDGTDLLEPSGRFRIEAVREAIGSRLHLVPRFRQVVHVPRRGLGGPLWVDPPSFDLSEHVRVLPLPAGTGEAELLLAIERLRSRRLDPSRPLWEMWFLTGLPDDRIAMFVKLHHAIADGMAAMATISAFLDTAPDAPTAPARPWAPTRPPSARQLLADNLMRHVERLAGAFSTLARPRTTLRRLRAAWPAARELLPEAPAPETSLDRMVGPGRNLALVRTTLDAVKEAAHAHDATVNDLLLAVTAGGLRALLRSRGEPVEDTTVRVYVPVSLRRRVRGPQQGNLIAQMAVPLPVGGADPGRRLRQIAAETARRKARTRTSLGTLFRGRIARRLLLKAVMRQRVNVTTASIPGPTMPLYLAGARVLEVFPVLPLIANEPLGVGALSYAGAFDIGVVADRDAYPDLDVFAAGAREELHALGVPTDLRSIPDAEGVLP